jgi:hypothetical protein
MQPGQSHSPSLRTFCTGDSAEQGSRISNRAGLESPINNQKSVARENGDGLRRPLSAWGVEQLFGSEGRLMPPLRPLRGRTAYPETASLLRNPLKRIRLVARLVNPEANLLFDGKPLCGCGGKL